MAKTNKSKKNKANNNLDNIINKYRKQIKKEDDVIVKLSLLNELYTKYNVLLGFIDLVTIGEHKYSIISYEQYLDYLIKSNELKKGMEDKVNRVKLVWNKWHLRYKGTIYNEKYIKKILYDI